MSSCHPVYSLSSHHDAYDACVRAYDACDGASSYAPSYAPTYAPSHALVPLAYY